MMKRNVVTRETAKKLKAAGFQGVSMWHYSEDRSLQMSCFLRSPAV